MNILIKKKSFIILYFFLSKLNSLPEISKEIIEEEKANLKGTFIINSISKEKSFFSCNNYRLIISKQKEYFDIIETIEKSYYIICRNSMKIIGVEKYKSNYKVKLYSSFEQKYSNFIKWNLINIESQLNHFLSIIMNLEY